MPFRSENQRRFLWKYHPEIARKFAHHTTKIQSARLPTRVSTSDKNKKKDR